MDFFMVSYDFSIFIWFSYGLPEAKPRPKRRLNSARSRSKRCLLRCRSKAGPLWAGILQPRPWPWPSRSFVSFPRQNVFFSISSAKVYHLGYILGVKIISARKLRTQFKWRGSNWSNCCHPLKRTNPNNPEGSEHFEKVCSDLHAFWNMNKYRKPRQHIFTCMAKDVLLIAHWSSK